MGEDAEVPPSSGVAVDGDRIHQILQDARQRVRGILRDPRSTFDAEADALLARGRVVQLWDESGGCWFVPVNHRRMRLDERILSLAVAYYLMRPEELEASEIRTVPSNAAVEGRRSAV